MSAEISQRFSNNQFSLSSQYVSLNEAKKTITDNEALKEELKTKLELLGNVKKLLVRLKNNKMLEKKDFILTTINTALADVFMDKKIRLDIIASNTNQSASKLNIKYDIVIFENDIEMGRNEKLLIKIGGGVLSFMSILFKILVGFLYSKNRLYIFDESLAEVSELYRPRMAQFIQKFCEVHKFTIIVITQTSDIAEYADVAYLLDGDYDAKNVPILNIEKVLNYPKEDYYYTKIENFQSIVKLEFRYQGFTAIIGKNSIGKSASFRALNSILYNNFDMKEFPRITSSETPDKVLNSFIEFGKFTKEGDPQNDIFKISMRKKGASLIYHFNDTDYVGKNLAFEKVKEKIEQIGFKYLNLKEQYKNFKGNLKDQTERLAITTQQDSYYIVGDKSSDTAKVFDFLFDSRQVTSALLQVNDDSLSLEQQILQCDTNIHVAHRTISDLQVRIRYLELCLKIDAIELLQHYELNIEFEKYSIDLYTKLQNNLQKLISIHTVTDSIQQYQAEIEYNKQNIDQQESLLSKQNRIIDVISKIQMIQDILRINNDLNTFKSQISSLERNIDIYHRYILNYTYMQCIESVLMYNDTITVERKKQEKIIKEVQIYTALIEKCQNIYQLINLLNNVSIQQNYINEATSVIAFNNKLIYYYEVCLKIEEINKIKNMLNEMDAIEQTIKYWEYELTILPSKFNLEVCNKCNGLGLHHIH